MILVDVVEPFKKNKKNEKRSITVDQTERDKTILLDVLLLPLPQPIDSTLAA
jgi:hypothetical protein